MMILSLAFEDIHEIPEEFTCLGENISPPFKFVDVPKKAKSLVLLIEDMDSEGAKPWVHWLVFNINPETREVHEGMVPDKGTEGFANNGKPGYEGPCPKFFSGTHRYYFKLYALDKMLDLPSTANRDDVEKAMSGHIIDEAFIVGTCTTPAT